VLCALRNAGQTCICANRVFVADAVYDRFAAAVVEHVKLLKLGDGADAKTTIGPLISQAAVDKVCACWTSLQK
jgi:succinate-semialdehyde dehydrogenase/glutarate-semialdehyde dehydrogenase